VRAALSGEFADRVDVVTIERVAAEEVAAFNEARVGDFIAVLAIRRGRIRLREWEHPRGDGSGDLREVEGELGSAARLQERDEERQKGSV
jgi:hypothetical protein